MTHKIAVVSGKPRQNTLKSRYSVTDFKNAPLLKAHVNIIGKQQASEIKPDVKIARSTKELYRVV